MPQVPLPIGITPTGDKQMRFEAQASQIHAGRVVLPQTAPWLADFVAEVTRFPGGKHDDQADALAQMLAHPPLNTTMCNAGPEIVFVGDGADDYGFGDYSDDPWGAS